MHYPPSVCIYTFTHFSLFSKSLNYLTVSCRHDAPLFLNTWVFILLNQGRSLNVTSVQLPKSGNWCYYLICKTGLGFLPFVTVDFRAKIWVRLNFGIDVENRSEWGRLEIGHFDGLGKKIMMSRDKECSSVKNNEGKILSLWIVVVK